jgi:signal transduction histidine kinase
VKDYSLRLGLIISLLLSLFVLPSRIYEGQAANMHNLVGSQMVIWVLCFISWVSCISILKKSPFRLLLWNILLALIVCGFLSTISYTLSHHFFEDYPLRPVHKSPWLYGFLKLMFRGLLIGLILLPVIYLLEREKKILLLHITHERDLLKASRLKNELLEKTVAERTHYLEQAMLTLESSQKELGKQLYIQSRLIASVTHDISSPLQYISVIAEEVDTLIQQEAYENLAKYSTNLRSSTKNLSILMKNLLDFIRINVHDREVKFERVNLQSIIHEKTNFYHAMVALKNNNVVQQVDQNLFVNSNRTLLSIIIHNLIDNANKFSNGGEIHIGTNIREDNLELSLINHTSNSLITQKACSENGNSAPSSGIGLIITREIASLLSIDFSIHHADKFTRATLTFPTYFFANSNDDTQR